MIQSLLRFLGKLLVSGAVFAFIGIIIFLAVKSFPSSQSETSAYPAPVVTEPASSTLSPEVLCDQWFSYRKGQPKDQRNVIEEDYKNCVNARRTPSPVGVIKPLPSSPPSGKYSSPFIRRAAGIGTIIETNFSPLNSNYRIINQWFADLSGTHITVYAGGRQSDSARGDSVLNDLSWPGVLVVTVLDENGKILQKKGGVFWTPQNVGPVRIVDANGTILTLAAKDGSTFNFDVENLNFLSTNVGSFLSRSIGDGVLIESGKVQDQLGGFGFVNQWSNTDKNGNLITVFAGNEQYDPHKGVVIILVSPLDDHSKILEKIAYQTNLEDGALRIVDVESGIFTLVSESGLVYEFDLAKRQFLSLPSGSESVSIIPLVSEASGFGSELLSVTSTPTRTPTPRPTRTPLPTYNPYP
jgi:hypothetical protein